MGLSSTLNIGRDALLTQQKAIEVTAHNIANVNTPGYSRQQLIMEAKTPTSTYAGQLGTGVEGTHVERIVDRYLGDQINESAQSLGRWDAQRKEMEKVEIVFDESSGYGLNNAMSEFWDAWASLSNPMVSTNARQILQGEGENLANTFNSIYSELQEIQNDTDASISEAVDKINDLASQIDDLNRRIESIEASGENPNDYRDQRDQLLKELSSLIDFSSSESSDGIVTITLGDGNNLVDASGAFSLVATDTDSDGFIDIAWDSAPTVAINSSIEGGNLKGWLETRDTIIPDYLTQLDTLAVTLMNEVNAIHSSGYGLNDLVSRDFFTGTGAADISLSADIAADPNNIAVAQSNDGSRGLSGDNTNALAIASLQNSLLMNGNSATFDDYYNSIVSNVGIKVNEANQYYEHQDSMDAYLEEYRQSISGVSLDEEMVNLIKFQHAYDASAKLITAVDEMLDSLIRMV